MTIKQLKSMTPEQLKRFGKRLPYGRNLDSNNLLISNKWLSKIDDDDNDQENVETIDIKKFDKNNLFAHNNLESKEVEDKDLWIYSIYNKKGKEIFCILYSGNWTETRWDKKGRICRTFNSNNTTSENFYFPNVSISKEGKHIQKVHMKTYVKYYQFNPYKQLTRNEYNKLKNEHKSNWKKQKKSYKFLNQCLHCKVSLNNKNRMWHDECVDCFFGSFEVFYNIGKEEDD